jgi:hypothetical protein
VFCVTWSNFEQARGVTPKSPPQKCTISGCLPAHNFPTTVTTPTFILFYTGTPRQSRMLSHCACTIHGQTKRNAKPGSEGGCGVRLTAENCPFSGPRSTGRLSHAKHHASSMQNSVKSHWIAALLAACASHATQLCGTQVHGEPRDTPCLVSSPMPRHVPSPPASPLALPPIAL